MDIIFIRVVEFWASAGSVEGFPFCHFDAKRQDQRKWPATWWQTCPISDFSIFGLLGEGTFECLHLAILTCLGKCSNYQLCRCAVSDTLHVYDNVLDKFQWPAAELSTAPPSCSQNRRNPFVASCTRVQHGEYSANGKTKLVSLLICPSLLSRAAPPSHFVNCPSSLERAMANVRQQLRFHVYWHTGLDLCDPRRSLPCLRRPCL